MKFWGEWEMDKCPCCEEVEHTKHFVVCPDPNRQEVWTEVVNGLADWLVLTKTDPDIAHCICNTLRWRDEESKSVTMQNF